MAGVGHPRAARDPARAVRGRLAARRRDVLGAHGRRRRAARIPARRARDDAAPRAGDRGHHRAAVAPEPLERGLLPERDPVPVLRARVDPGPGRSCCRTASGRGSPGAVGGGRVRGAPQSALFFVLVLVTWLVNRRRLPQVRWPQLVGVSVPLVAMLVFSAWRFHAHTGYWAGVAENANMNLTAGRCHNIVTQAFPNAGRPASCRSAPRHPTTAGASACRASGSRPSCRPGTRSRCARRSAARRFASSVTSAIPRSTARSARVATRRTGVLGQLR